jgi:AcrR family transcriptional regulator
VSEASQRVVDTARRMFAEHGYADVSMRDLAAELGIQAPSIYSHFASKADVLRATLRPLMQETDALLVQAPPVPVSNAEVLRWLSAYIANNAQHRDAATILMIDLAARAELSSQMLQQSRRLAAMLELFGSPDRMTTVSVLGAICLPVVTGELQPSEAERLARTLLPLLRPQPRVGVGSRGRAAKASTPATGSRQARQRG